MSFDPIECWDGPMDARVAAALALAGLVLAGLTGFFASRPRIRVRALAAATAIPALLCLLALTSGAVRSGFSWHRCEIPGLIEDWRVNTGLFAIRLALVAGCWLDAGLLLRRFSRPPAID
jgi:hypothetical protein